MRRSGWNDTLCDWAALYREAWLKERETMVRLTPPQVGRIERGECRAPHAALSKPAKAHETSTSDFMARLAA